VNYDNSLVVTITVTCNLWAPSSCDHLFTCSAIYLPPQRTPSAGFAKLMFVVHFLRCLLLQRKYPLLTWFSVYSKIRSTGTYAEVTYDDQAKRFSYFLLTPPGGVGENGEESAQLGFTISYSSYQWKCTQLQLFSLVNTSSTAWQLALH